MGSLADIPFFEMGSETPGASVHRNHIIMTGSHGEEIHILVLEEDLIRIRVLPNGSNTNPPILPKTWSIAPGKEDVENEGRSCLDLSGFSLPAFESKVGQHTFELATHKIRLVVDRKGGICRWFLQDPKIQMQQHGSTFPSVLSGHDGSSVLVLQDRKTQAYNFGYFDDKIYHYIQNLSGEMYIGLGERSGYSMDRKGQRFRLTNVDCMGYDAATSDPLYKHIPFYITWNPSNSTGFGIFYDTTSDCTFDFGKEIDNYHGPYRSFIADYGQDLDYYFIASPITPLNAVKRFTWLTGKPAFTPKWGLGYSGSTMSYTDSSNAQERMGEFLENCKKYDILCDSFHLSSGYTSIGTKRYVFNWNHTKFPDIPGFVNSYKDHGVRICANIKPCLLRDHPMFGECQDKKLFLLDQNGKPFFVQFWGDVGSYIDFTNPEAQQWWSSNIQQSLLSFGIDSTWNDNNEYEIWNPKCLASGFGSAFRAIERKPLQTLLMMKTSRSSQLEFDASKRPFLVSRSGGVGMHRYVQTWSGDNYTSWRTVKYNIKMGLGLAMSGISNFGHDVGGFAGPAPDADLFVRWIQSCLFLPRFSIHSWNDDGTVNEPWMHGDDVTQTVSNLIKLRYKFIPFLYNLLWLYHQCYEPMIRPMFAEFPDDLKVYEESNQFLIGNSILQCPVCDPNKEFVQVYLPSSGSCQWTSYWTGISYMGGQTVILPSTWDLPTFLIREGSIIPINVADLHFPMTSNRNRLIDQRGFLVVPHSNSSIAQGSFIEDDGETEQWRNGIRTNWKIEINPVDDCLAMSIFLPGEFRLTQLGTKIEVFLPLSETRQLVMATGGKPIEVDPCGGWRRIIVDLAGFFELLQ